VNQAVAGETRLRSPDVVMRLDRMGSFFPTRLSFMRSFMRYLASELAQVSRPVWQMNAQGFGRAVYSVRLAKQDYSLVAFSNALKDEDRSDRVIASAWDTAFVLFDGVPDVDDLDRLQKNAPHQEAGRFTGSELTLSRANKSTRFFEHVVDRLSRGEQPDAALLTKTGYLMRTTAVYGNGKFGIADRRKIMHRAPFKGPYQAEMLTVWLIREFSMDLADHVASARDPANAVCLHSDVRRQLGVGNATGLGMAPFLVNHPVLLNNWVRAYETALNRVRAIKRCPDKVAQTILLLIRRAKAHLQQWSVDDEIQTARIITLRRELAEISDFVTPARLAGPYPFAKLLDAAGAYSLECQELLAALVLEPHGPLIDDLTDEMASETEDVFDPSMTVSAVRRLIDSNYDWALQIDFTRQRATEMFWYTSAAKLEPRVGNRFTEPGAEWEMPLDIAFRVRALVRDLAGADAKMTVARFLAGKPAHRYVIQRIQINAAHPYSEIRDNLIDGGCRPIDMLRFKLAFFGASKFDPKSDLWTRINMFQGAPLRGDIAAGDVDDWWLPVLEGAV